MKQLQKLGLSYYESRAMAVLLRERCTLKGLAKKAAVPAGKVYSVVQSLRQRGLVAESEGRPKEVSVPDPGAVVAHLIAQKQRDDEALFRELRTMASQMLPSSRNPFFQLGTTSHENRAIQLRTFTEAERDMCQVLNIHHKPTMNRSSKTLREEGIEKAVARGVGGTRGAVLARDDSGAIPCRRAHRRL